MLIDRAQIHVAAGQGGNGSLSFRREKFVPLGGPDGGDGGKGGDVVLEVAENITSLVEFQFNQKFEAQPGQAGMSRKKHGRNGADKVIKVPPGTVVWDEGTGDQIADLTEPGESFVVAKGGRGGLGNTHFRTSIRQAPRIAELGEPGDELDLRLELRLIADVGLVGLPNAGKSTFLAAATRARPKIADYPFTTLEPNLGVVLIGGRGGQTFVLADVPGLIEGAAGGAGLGHEFLRHVSRTRVLIHLVDASGGLEGRDPLADFRAIEAELQEYDPELAARSTVVALNKVDLEEARANAKKLRKSLEKKGFQVFEISAATGEGVQELLNHVAGSLRQLSLVEKEVAKKAERKIYTLPETDERAFTITQIDENSFVVKGKSIERLARMTNWDLDDATNRFQSVLEASGIEKELQKMGVQEGDVVAIADYELIWGDQLDEDDLKPSRRTATQRKTSRKRAVEMNDAEYEEFLQEFES